MLMVIGFLVIVAGSNCLPTFDVVTDKSVTNERNGRFFFDVSKIVNFYIVEFNYRESISAF